MKIITAGGLAGIHDGSDGRRTAAAQADLSEGAKFTRQLSLGLSVLLIIAYGLGMLFSLKTHREQFASAAHGEERETPWPIGFALGALAGVTVRVASASDSKVALTSCPPAVQKTIQAKAGANKIVAITKSVEDGDVEYAVTLGEGKQKRGFSVTDEGDFLGWEDGQVELADCPPAVQKAIKENAAGAAVEGIEDYTDEFVVTLKKGDKESTLYITPAGKVRAREDQLGLAGCPEAVQKTIRVKAGQNKIVTVTKAGEEGGVEYEVTVLRGKLERTFTVADDGEFGEWSSETVELKDCPPVVQKTIKEYAAGATIAAIEDSVEEFIVDLTKGNEESTLSIAADGKLLSQEVRVALSSCPAAVQETIKAKAGRGKIEAVYKVTEGESVKYTATIATGFAPANSHLQPSALTYTKV